MNCLDCALTGQHGEVVAVCTSCGAAVCLDHSHTAAVTLTRTAAINRVVLVEPAARVVRCTTCAAAVDAAGNGQPDHWHAAAFR